MRGEPAIISARSSHPGVVNVAFGDALKKAGCERIYTDKISGASENRCGLDKALDQLRAGDTLVV